MTHEYGHVECGGVGTILRWAVLHDGDLRIPIPVYSRALVMHIYNAGGIDHKTTEKADKMSVDFRHKYYRLLAQPGESIYYESPDPPP